MIGVSVARKARSSTITKIPRVFQILRCSTSSALMLLSVFLFLTSTKRSHECWASSSGIASEQNHRQASTSLVRTTIAGALASPSSSNASVRKKIIANGRPKFRPPKSSSNSSSPAQEEIEIEIAEVLYDMMRQPQGPSKEEIMANDLVKFDSNKASSDAKSRISSSISNSQSAPPQNSSSFAAPIFVVGGFFQRVEV